jgi:phospholipase/carboxylesterase
MPNIEYLEILHGDSPSHTIIWLHGLGADGHDFVPIVPQLHLHDNISVRFIFPHAPSRPVTVNGGMVMPAWYDISGTDIADKEDRDGMDASRDLLLELVANEEARGIATENIILAGFSQGGAVVLYTALRSNTRFAGIMALSTYLPFSEQAAAENTGVNAKSPLFMAHGTLDPVVPIQLGEASMRLLVSLGYSPSWHTYTMPHSVSPEETGDIGNWLKEILSP